MGTGVEGSDIPLRQLTAAEQTHVARVLRRLGIAAFARRRFLSLSQGERRLVLLARALASRPALLLLDEPLNGLDAPNRARVLAALATVARSQLPWILATHRPEEVPASATHLAVLQHGALRTGRWRPWVAARAARPPRTRRAAVPAPDDGRELLIQMRNATVWRASTAVLRRMSLQIRAGDCWAVHGANGSGKSTLLATLYGDHAMATPGRISRRGYRPGAPLHEFQRQLGRVSPELQAALPRRHTALECVVAGHRGALVLDGVMSASERRAATRALRWAGASALAQRTIAELSHGQARRVLFARALVRQPDMVLLDEPYTGLDAPTRVQLRALIDGLACQERTIVIATHYRDDWPRRATHELELAAGGVRYCGLLRRRKPAVAT